MGSVNPISPRSQELSTVKKVKAKGPTQSQTTAAKVSQIKLPTLSQKPVLGDRQVTLLKEANDLSQSIKSNWDELAPDQLAEKIIELEDKVHLLKDTSPAIDKIKKQTQNLHFKFVFPIALAMDAAPSENAMSISFARTVFKAANEVFKTNSIRAFSELNGTQKREVMRYAAGRVS